jgi:hypothetical protein
MEPRGILWQREHVAGAEAAFVTFGPRRITAVGTAIGSEPDPYRLLYTLETEGDYATTRCAATAEGLGFRRSIELRRDADGRWTCEAETHGGSNLGRAGADTAALEGVLDVDIGYSPLTNTPPILRAGLLANHPAYDVDAAWISVPDLAVVRLEQRYAFVERRDDGAVVRYATRNGSFVADLTCDADGFVLRYPGLASMVAP